MESDPGPELDWISGRPVGLAVLTGLSAGELSIGPLPCHVTKIYRYQIGFTRFSNSLMTEFVFSDNPGSVGTKCVQTRERTPVQ